MTDRLLFENQKKAADPQKQTARNTERIAKKMDDNTKAIQRLAEALREGDGDEPGGAGRVFVPGG